MRYFMVFLLLICASPVLAAEGNTFNWQRARDNYVSLIDGRKQFDQLTAFEQLELKEFRRRLEEEVIDPRSQRERCEDEQIKRLGSKRMTALDRRHINMVCRGESD